MKESIGEITKFGGKANFCATVFVGMASYKNSIFEAELSFQDTIFKERCDLRVESFGTHVDVTGAEFRAWVFIDWKKLCNNENKPVKAIIGYENCGDNKPKESKYYHKVRENLHVVKEMLHKVSAYNGEDLFYYWYKIYERENYRKDCKEKYKKRTCLNKFKGILKYIFQFIEYWFIKRLFLDKITGYFTKPKRVFWAIPSTISFFTFLYCLPWCSIKNVPTKEVLWNDLTLAFKSFDNVWLFFEHLGKTLYFSAITFSTIGYGDYHPVGFWTMLLAAIEGIIGVLLMSTFLVTLTRKVLR